jgi:hypothetical protein
MGLGPCTRDVGKFHKKHSQQELFEVRLVDGNVAAHQALDGKRA